MRVLTVLLCLAAPAAAETAMTATEFEAWAEGYTLDYYVDGALWGSEQHLPGRETRDADVDGPCHAGRWQPRGDAICFSYDVSPGPHCWRFSRDGDTVQAEILGNADATRYTVRRSDTPLACPAPDVGV